MDAVTVSERKPKKVSKPTIMPQDMQLAEFKRQDWVADVDEKLSVEDICDPSYWVHRAPDIEAYAKIEARWKDGTKIVHLRVKFVERTYVKVQVISIEELEAVEAPATSLLYEIRFRGPRLWSVIRRTDNAVMAENLKQRDMATSWIVEHEKH